VETPEEHVRRRVRAHRWTRASQLPEINRTSQSTDIIPVILGNSIALFAAHSSSRMAVLEIFIEVFGNLHRLPETSVSSLLSVQESLLSARASPLSEEPLWSNTR
jgi:hypothetical protein